MSQPGVWAVHCRHFSDKEKGYLDMDVPSFVAEIYQNFSKIVVYLHGHVG